MSMGERVKKARVAAGLTQKELADAIFCSIGTISRIETNPDATLNNLNLHKVASALGCRENWLITGKGAMQSPSQQKTVVARDQLKLPVLSFGQVTSIKMEPDEMLSTDNQETITVSNEFGENSFAMKVPTFIGGKIFPENAIIIVNREEAPSNGSYILAILPNENTPCIRQYIVDGERRYLIPLVENIPLIEALPQTTILGTIKQMIVNFP